MPLSRWSRRHKRTFGKKKQDESKVSVDIVDIGFILNEVS